VEELTAAIDLDPDDVRRLLLASSQLCRLEEIDLAAEYLARASALAPPHPIYQNTMLNLGARIAAAKGHDESAEQGLRRALQAEPGNAQFARDLASFLTQRDRVTEALELVEASLPQADHPDALMAFVDELRRDAQASPREPPG
jgi:Tfp pilus assembly protein PilF